MAVLILKKVAPIVAGSTTGTRPGTGPGRRAAAQRPANRQTVAVRRCGIGHAAAFTAARAPGPGRQRGWSAVGARAPARTESLKSGQNGAPAATRTRDPRLRRPVVRDVQKVASFSRFLPADRPAVRGGYISSSR